MKVSALVLSLAFATSGFVASAIAADDTTKAPTKTRAEQKAEVKDARATGTLPNTGDKPFNEGERSTTPAKKKAKKAKKTDTTTTPTTPAS